MALIPADSRRRRGVRLALSRRLVVGSGFIARFRTIGRDIMTYRLAESPDRLDDPGRLQLRFAESPPIPVEPPGAYPPVSRSRRASGLLGSSPKVRASGGHFILCRASPLGHILAEGEVLLREYREA